MSPALSQKCGMRLLVATGASGGHLYPALSFIEASLRRMPDARVTLIVPSSSVTQRVKRAGFQIEYVPAVRLGLRISFDTIRALKVYLKNALRCISILIRCKPDAVVGFGTLVSAPVIAAAWFLRVPTIIHEQNVRPGKANWFLTHFVDAVAISFEESRRYVRRSSQTVVYTGNPIRASMVPIDKRQARNAVHLDPDIFTLLVVGGSQGSHRINKTFMEALTRMAPTLRLQVIQLTGSQDALWAGEQYRTIPFRHYLCAFEESMSVVYSASDLIIARAGASTIAEIIRFQVPAILIPYPFAGNHQFANALVLSRRNAAMILEESALTAVRLQAAIEALMHDAAKRAAMQQALRGCGNVDAADRLVSLVQSTVTVQDA